MSKTTRTPQTHEEQLRYWKKRIGDKLHTTANTINPPLAEVFQMARHIGVPEQVIEKFQGKLNEAFQELEQSISDQA